MTNRHAALAALVAVVWGFNFVVIEWGMRDVPPLLFAAVRFAVVVVVAVPFVPRPDASRRTVVAVGTFMSLGQFGLLYTAIHLGLPPGIAALVLQVQVVFTIVIAAVFLRERPTASQVAGIGVGVAGLVVVGLGRDGDVPLAGLGLCVLAGLSWALGNVISRASGVPGGLSLTVWSSTVVPVPLLALTLALDGPAAVWDGFASLTWRAGVSTAYTAVLATLVGYGVFNALLHRYPPSAVVPWVLLAPVVAMTSAWWLLGQRPAAFEAVGGVVLLAGVLIALRPTAGWSIRGRPRRSAPGAAARASAAAG